jgi:Saxitoxin biosynthesis operon protein SxtJ
MTKKLSELDIYKANLAITAGLLVFYAINHNKYLLYGAVGVSVLTVLLPTVAEYISRGWYALAKALGYVNSKVLLTVVFFGFLLPFGLIFQFLNRRALSLRTGRADKSLFVARNHRYEARDFDTTW